MWHPCMGDRARVEPVIASALATPPRQGSAGWPRFDILHDRERILLETVAGDRFFAAILAPEH